MMRAKKHARRQEAAPGFKPRERLIYRFWDGSRTRHADPLEVQARLLAFPNLDLQTDLKLVATDTPESAAALDRIVAAVRHAFQIPEFNDDAGDPVGLTKAECWGLFQDFGRYFETLKKKLSGSRTSSNATATSEANGSATNNGAGSSGTKTESSSEGP